jgi:hypothetical protein
MKLKIIGLSEYNDVYQVVELKTNEVKFQGSKEDCKKYKDK